MLRYYHVDIDDLRRGRVTPRRVATLISALPLDAATHRALHGETARWTLTDHLLAGITDVLNVISWQLGGDRRVPRPRPLPRPGVAATTFRHGRTSRPPREVVAYLRRYGPPREVTDG